MNRIKWLFYGVIAMLSAVGAWLFKRSIQDHEKNFEAGKEQQRKEQAKLNEIKQHEDDINRINDPDQRYTSTVERARNIILLAKKRRDRKL